MQLEKVSTRREELRVGSVSFWWVGISISVRK